MFKKVAPYMGEYKKYTFRAFGICDAESVRDTFI